MWAVRRRRRDERCARDGRRGAWLRGRRLAAIAAHESDGAVESFEADGADDGPPGPAPGRCRPARGQPVTARGREVAGAKGQFPWRGTKARKRNRTPALSSSSNV